MTPDEESEAQQLMSAYSVVMMHQDSRIVIRWVWRVVIIAVIVAAWHTRWRDAGGLFVLGVLLNLIVSFWYTRKAYVKTGIPRQQQAVYYHSYRTDPAFREVIDAIFLRHMMKIVSKSKPK